MAADGGGWMVIQRRIKGGNINFNRTWNEYHTGFGDLEGEFWYGLESIACLTYRNSMELRIDMNDGNGTEISWTYKTFRIDNYHYKHRLHIGGGYGTPGSGDGMGRYNNLNFSTVDRDNDGHINFNCARVLSSGWWYSSECAAPNFAKLNTPHGDILWPYGEGHSRKYFPNVEMMIRQRKHIFDSVSCRR